MRKLVTLAVVAVGGVIAARRLLASEGLRPDGRARATIRQRMMARMIEGLPADSPPKLVMSILPRLRDQNDEIIALLREQNRLLQRHRLEPMARDSDSPGQ